MIIGNLNIRVYFDLLIFCLSCRLVFVLFFRNDLFFFFKIVVRVFECFKFYVMVNWLLKIELLFYIIGIKRSWIKLFRNNVIKFCWFN